MALTQEQIQELSEGNINEIEAALPDMHDDDIAYLLQLENEKDKPRAGVLKLLTKAEDEFPAEDMLDTRKPYSMIHHDNVKHYFQDGKIYNQVSKKMLVDTSKKK